MINKELFLDLVQNHHHRGEYTDDKGNYCLLGAAAKATDGLDHAFGAPNTGESFRRLKESLTDQIILHSAIHCHVHEFNDDELRVSHEDIMLVAKKAVEEL